jgi:Uma2 family endonuclease
LLTVAEYSALGETAWGYTELIQGRVLMSPGPGLAHGRALVQLCMELHDQLPDAWDAVHNLDVNLELVAPDEPGFSRRPDMIIIEEQAGHRASAENRMVRASEVLVVVELAAKDTRRIDHLDKRQDYADAGIPNYWIVDLDEPVSLTACRLTEEFGYMDDQTATGTFRTDVPFPFEVNLDRLV